MAHRLPISRMKAILKRAAGYDGATVLRLEVGRTPLTGQLGGNAVTGKVLNGDIWLTGYHLETRADDDGCIEPRWVTAPRIRFSLTELEEWKRLLGL